MIQYPQVQKKQPGIYKVSYRKANAFNSLLTTFLLKVWHLPSVSSSCWDFPDAFLDEDGASTSSVFSSADAFSPSYHTNNISCQLYTMTHSYFPQYLQLAFRPRVSSSCTASETGGISTIFLNEETPALLAFKTFTLLSMQGDSDGDCSRYFWLKRLVQCLSGITVR